MRPLTIAAVALLGLLPAVAGAAPQRVGESDQPVPRFVSLRANEANMRSGPGDQYPITWVYRRKGLPVEVVREYGIWRLVRDPDGTSGWMNMALLSSERMAYVTRAVRTLYARSDVASRPVWRVEPGVVARIVLCLDAWCQISIDGKSGYVLRDQLWGVYPGEALE